MIMSYNQWVSRRCKHEYFADSVCQGFKIHVTQLPSCHFSHYVNLYIWLNESHEGLSLVIYTDPF